MSKRKDQGGARSPDSIQNDLFRERSMERLRQKVMDLGGKRKELLRKKMARLFSDAPVFEVREGRHYDGTPQASINTAGIARNAGFAFKGIRQYRLMVQETLRIGGGPGPFHIAHYTYAIHDATTAQRLFRFEYHPDLKDGSDRFSVIHHLHVENASQKVGELHFPLWPFIQHEDPHLVLELILEWCTDQLRKID